MKLLNIRKSYGERTVLRIEALELETGKITSVLGESGAGKTTLLAVVAGRTPFEGTVEGAGRVSYLYQSPTLLPNLTAEDNLKFVLPEERFGEIGAMLARVGLSGKEKRYPKQLSGGERQRVAIARAFLYPHDTLLMDEPFSSLDLSLKRSLLQLVGELSAESGSTVLFVTHDIHEAAMLASRALVLREGELVLDLPINSARPHDFFRPAEEEETLLRALMRQDDRTAPEIPPTDR